MQERTILLDGFSKTYAMTGWRMGYGVMRPDLAAHITRLMTNSNSCTASFTQIAGIEAIRGDQTSVDHMRDEFQSRRDVFVAGLNKIKGFSCRMPKGAFYVFPNITADRMEVEEACRRVAGTGRRRRLSGTAFGEYGEGYLRFSVANSLENLHKALERIDQWAEKTCSRLSIWSDWIFTVAEEVQALNRHSAGQAQSSRPHMPGYGLPKGSKGLLPWSWAEQRLRSRTTTGSPPSSPTDRRTRWSFGDFGSMAVFSSAPAANRARPEIWRRIQSA